MDSRQWALLSHCFSEAVRLPAEEREAFVSNHCEGDDEVRAQVLSLLDAYRRNPHDPLATPIVTPRGETDPGPPRDHVPVPPLPPDEEPVLGRWGEFELRAEIG